MLGEPGTEQFTISARVDGEIIKAQRIHDPFLHSTTVVGISRWDLFKGLFRRQYEVKVEIAIEGSEGIQLVIMMLDPEKLQRETESILEQRRLSREGFVGDNHCFAVEN